MNPPMTHRRGSPELYDCDSARCTDRIAELDKRVTTHETLLSDHFKDHARMASLVKWVVTVAIMLWGSAIATGGFLLALRGH